MEKEAENKMEFFGGLMSAFKEERQVDIWLQAGDQSDAIPAHKLILVARSKVFRKILELDDCKGSSMSSKETVTLSEMTHDELETFLDFLYKGSLPDAKLVHHLRSLYLSAHKYEIPYLQDLCRKELISTIHLSNVFDNVELAKIYSDKILEDAVSRFIQSHMKEVAFEREFMSFVESNPALAVDTIRGHLVAIDVSKICNRPESISSSFSEHIASTVRKNFKKISGEQLWELWKQEQAGCLWSS
uniref:BTB/POZ domain-containing protein n=1 Tax=Noccaea caerulescens TaxID=107243 RepID=A0A1J3FB14_NOCCA